MSARASRLLAAAAFAGALAPATTRAQDAVVQAPPPLTVAGEDDARGQDVDEVAADSPPPPPEVLPPLDLVDCTFLPEPRCEASIVAEFAIAGGVSHAYLGTQGMLHLTMEAGGLFQTGWHPDLHAGPTFELAWEAYGPLTGWMAASKARARYFIAGSHAVVEGALGVAGTRFVYGGSATESGTRLGGVFELGIGYRGIVSAWGQVGALGDLGGHAGTDVRAVAGLRANLTGWGVALTGGRALE